MTESTYKNNDCVILLDGLWGMMKYEIILTQYKTKLM